LFFLWAACIVAQRAASFFHRAEKSFAPARFF